MKTSVLHRVDAADGSRVMFSLFAGQRVVTVSSRRRPIARVVQIHGLGDHAGRHVMHARRLAARGYAVTIVELAGHGGQPGDWAETLHVYDAYARNDRPSDLLALFRNERIFPAPVREALAARQYQRLANTSAAEHLAQVAAVVEHLDHLDPGAAGLPLILIGHSMGGLIAHETVWRMAPALRPTLAGVVMIAPAFGPQGNPASPAMQLAVSGLWRLRLLPVSPTRAAAKALLGLNFPVDTTWGKKWLSDVAPEVELFATDPLVPHRLPTRYASSIESLMAASSRRPAMTPYEAFMLLPSRDGITSREAAVEFASRANPAAGATRVASATFDVVAHDLLRSSARERAFRSIEQWMDARVTSRAPGVLAHSKAS